MNLAIHSNQDIKATGAGAPARRADGNFGQPARGRLSELRRRHQRLRRQLVLWSQRLDLAELAARIKHVEARLASNQRPGHEAATRSVAEKARRARLDAEIRHCRLELALARVNRSAEDRVLEHQGEIEHLREILPSYQAHLSAWRRFESELAGHVKKQDAAFRALELPQPQLRALEVAWRRPATADTVQRLCAASARCEDLLQLRRGLLVEHKRLARLVAGRSMSDRRILAPVAAAATLLVCAGLLGFLGGVEAGKLTSLVACSLATVLLVLGSRLRAPGGQATANAELADLEAALDGRSGGSGEHSNLPILRRLQVVQGELEIQLVELGLPSLPADEQWETRLLCLQELLVVLGERAHTDQQRQRGDEELRRHEQDAGDLARALKIEAPDRGALGSFVEGLERRLAAARQAESTCAAGRQSEKELTVRLGDLEARRRALSEEDKTPAAAQLPGEPPGERPASVPDLRQQVLQLEKRRGLELRLKEMRRLAKESAAALGWHDWREVLEVWDVKYLRSKRAEIKTQMQTLGRDIHALRATLTGDTEPVGIGR